VGKNLYQKVWDDHLVGTLENRQCQVFMALHLIHEVTSPQAFGMLKDKGLKVAFPERTFATVDHIIPTDDQSRPFQDEMADRMISVLAESTQTHGIEFFSRILGPKALSMSLGRNWV
jgi:3-isopropylmalate/(R)-2-methylmalate dehydratase large subunit